jgi:hypothetical protein
MGRNDDAGSRHALIGALEALLSTATDGDARRVAAFYLRRLGTPPQDLETLVREIRDELARPKTAFNDVADPSAEFLAARDRASATAEEALRHLIETRRPDLAALVRLAREES